ncbi:MAG: pyridoxal phosphate-dependent aminotransferase [Gemmatimonadetes bacterium]|nr:pyridoxal phosphate-dependent aminotransferase [Gemmatimonadota bacterium]
MGRRLSGIPGFSIDQVAAAAGDDPDVLRLENLDTDLAPPPAAIEATRRAIGQDDDNSYLPFTGQDQLRANVAARARTQTGIDYDPSDVVITCGGTEGMLDALFALTEPGDEVVVTDPTYAGMIYRPRLVGAVPRFAPFVIDGDEWRLDLDALSGAVGPKTRAIFLMNPSMPSGAVLNATEWDAVAALCRERDLWLLYNAAMERIVFDGRSVAHPATLPGMAERTVIIGSVSKEYRMIGWRVGWVYGPREVMADVALAHIYNTTTAIGIAQAGAIAALNEPEAEFARCVSIWERRRDVVTRELAQYGAIPAAGGWSQLLDVGALGFDSMTASKLLLENGRVAATPMRNWGDVNGDRLVRLVFSNEPVERLRGLGDRALRALGATGR